MANTKSAKKAIRVSSRKNAVNKKNKTAYRDARKAVMKAVASNDSKKANELLPEAYKQIDFASKKGTIHKNTASRYKSRLASAVVGIK